MSVRWTTPVPKGFRDVYWCHYLNEPVILKYAKIAGDQPRCDGCGVVYDSVAQMTDNGHTFICHILKPAEWTETPFAFPPQGGERTEPGIN